MRRTHQIIAIASLAVIAASAPNAYAATAEERAKCLDMQKQMGTEPRHEHSQDKGQGPGPMNINHARCKEILAEPAADKGNKHNPK